jgi:hypothetical protein
MAAWPSSLPQIALADGFSEWASPNLILTENNAGPAKRRPKYTTVVMHQVVPLLLTTAQVATFETFFNSTIAFGSLPFDWLFQRTGATVSMYINEHSPYEQVAADLWRTTLSLEWIA